MVCYRADGMGGCTCTTSGLPSDTHHRLLNVPRHSSVMSCQCWAIIPIIHQGRFLIPRNLGCENLEKGENAKERKRWAKKERESFLQKKTNFGIDYQMC